MDNIEAIVLAAGKGKRMKSLTKDLPKPLIKVGGLTLIDRVLDDLANSGIGRAIVNTHYLGHMLKKHLSDRKLSKKKPIITFSDEKDKLLDTGGAIVFAMPLIKCKKIFIVNSDIIKFDENNDSYKALFEKFDSKKMDFLLLLQPTEGAIGYDGYGDFELSHNLKLSRANQNSNKSYVYAGVCICEKKIFEKINSNTFSLNLLWDKSILKNRLYGFVHKGKWFHVGTLDGYHSAERFFNNE
ncbi:nucleotidyltransferase family protein [Alphaproteobacteria bacterium]|nr:nucleotidyltransferase family protein [Alphaproteobacteria bacterium]